jgi:S-adenosyl-L-methionine hydrolase (adenosine-forming)
MFQPNGILTLLSDFGTRDGYAGAMKGAALSIDQRLNVLDLAHDVPPFDVRVGAYTLRQAIATFPAGTVHVAVVDPGVGTGRKAMIALTLGQVVVAPDNGLLSMILHHDPEASLFALDFDAVGLVEKAKTFHGRDLFAPSGALVAAGRLRVPGALEAIEEPVRFPCGYEREDERLVGHYLCADRFGNLITSIPASEIAAPQDSRVRFGPVLVDRIVQTYGEASPGSLVALAGSMGLLEVSLVEGDAHALLEPVESVRVEVEPRRVRAPAGLKPAGSPSPPASEAAAPEGSSPEQRES